MRMKVWKGFKDKDQTKPCPYQQEGVRHSLDPRVTLWLEGIKASVSSWQSKGTPVTSWPEDGKCGHISECIRWITIRINLGLENVSTFSLSDEDKDYRQGKE